MILVPEKTVVLTRKGVTSLGRRYLTDFADEINKTKTMEIGGHGETVVI